MDNKEVQLLKKALERQKQARKQAERILEEKSKELYDLNRHLKEVNTRLEHLAPGHAQKLDTVFLNIIDPYVVMDLQFNVMEMNSSAKEFFMVSEVGQINLGAMVHTDFLEYTRQSFATLLEVGLLKNYRSKIKLPNGSLKWVLVNASLIYDSQRKPIAAQGIVRDVTQEMEIKELLAEQKNQLDIIVENSPMGIVLTDGPYIIKANKTFSKLLGYGERQLAGMTVEEISCAAYKEETQEYMHKMYAGEINRFTIIKKYQKKDGGQLIARTLVNAVKDKDGKVINQVAFVEDIAKEKAAEEDLRASENRLASLILNLQTGVLLEDENRKIALTNQLFCSMFQIGVAPEQLVGADCTTSAEQTKHMFKDPVTFVERINTILDQKKKVLNDELEMVDGRVLERDYIPIFNNGSYKGHLWTYQDITLRKKYKVDIEAQREKYSSIIANMNLGLIEVDNEGVILLTNQSFCEMSGYREEELLGKLALDVIQVKNKRLVEEKTSSRTTGVSDSYEIEVITRNGKTKHWLISAAPRYDVNGSIIGSIGIHLDITEQKALELEKEQLVKELENSNKGLQEYAHIVSHDLKSPLRSISALATWIQEDSKEMLDEQNKQNLGLLQEKVASMDKLIHGILEYSTANNSKLDQTEVNLNKVIDTIRDSIYIPEHVRLSVPKTLPTIMADRTKMHQLFQNIISNAVVNIEKEQGLVEVLFQEDADFWRFTISDNGVGIPKEYHKKIFEIFQSVGNKERSTGIGLSIVKKIIDRYQGSIWLKSELEEGTQFYFTISKNGSTI